MAEDSAGAWLMRRIDHPLVRVLGLPFLVRDLVISVLALGAVGTGVAKLEVVAIALGVLALIGLVASIAAPARTRSAEPVSPEAVGYIADDLERAHDRILRAVESDHWWEGPEPLRTDVWQQYGGKLAQSAAHPALRAAYQDIDRVNERVAKAPKETPVPVIVQLGEGAFIGLSKRSNSCLEQARDTIAVALEALTGSRPRQSASPSEPKQTGALSRAMKHARTEQEARQWRNRQRFAEALAIAYRDGLFWTGENVPRSQWAHWAQRTQDLIREALGEAEAQGFDTDWSDGNVSLKGLGARQQRLAELSQRAQKVSRPLQLRPDFEGQDWVSRR